MTFIEKFKNMVKRNRAEEVAQVKTEIIYPRYLSTAPHGEDLYEGKSQEKIKDAIEKYILDTDNPNIELSEAKMPRLIGLEGKWGSGKSNIIKMLEDDSVLNKNYVFFTYDTWGNQEDLQRKAILYMLTKQLIAKKLLVKKTTMRQYDPLEDNTPTEKECTWNERLESLSSTTSFTKEVSVPSIHTSTKWFGLVLVIMGLFIGILQIDGFFVWWVNVLISLLPMAIFLVFLKFKSKDGFVAGWRRMFKMYDSGATTDTTSYVISKEDPTSSEFKAWMRDLSVSLVENKKLVIVFDNMDRLSKEKVHTLWSSIHTFFADSDSGYENIWCMIPFDAQHLALAFEGSEEEQDDLLKRFLQKTFPVIYKVPEPIVTDYKEVVNKLIHRAFGDKLQEPEYDIINRCYRLTYREPNVREIIAFINELVQIYHTWNSDKIDIVSMAVYVLQKQKIDSPQNEHTSLNSELYILDKEYEKDYIGALKSCDSENMQRNIAALHYGVKPEKAYTIMQKRVLKGSLEGKDTNGNALVPYMFDKEQLSILDEVFYEIDPIKYENIIKYFVSCEDNEIIPEAKQILQKFWKHMADDFLDSNEAVSSVSDYHLCLIEHQSAEYQTSCAKHLINRLYKNESLKGDSLFMHLNRLFEQPFAQDWNVKNVCPRHSLKPAEFLNYVHAAQVDFDKYPISSDEAKLNEYLQSLITDDFGYVEEVRLLKDSYNLNPFVNKTIEVMSAGKSEAKVVGKLLQIQRIHFDKFQNTKISTAYIQQLWNSVVGHPEFEYYPEILALQAFLNAIGELPHDDNHISWLKERMYFYATTAELIEELPNKRYQYFIKLIKEIILNKNHDGVPTNNNWINNWQLTVQLCQVERAQLIAFASDWGYQLSDSEKKTSIKKLLAEVEWIDTLKNDSITPLADSIIQKFADEVNACPITEFIQNGTIITPTHSYCYNALKRLIDTSYIPNTEIGVLRELVLAIIRFAAKGNKIDNEVWLKVVGKCKFTAISTEMNELRRKVLNKTDGYVITPNNFGFLHEYLEKTEINSESHKNDAANVILLNVIDNLECQKIIMKSDYYKPIISETQETASALHEKIKSIELTNPDSDFSKYLLDLVNYLPVEQSKTEDEKNGIE